MSGQLSYTYHTPKGVAGSLVDINAYSIDSRANGETRPGVMRFGMGAMIGESPGVTVRVPDASMTDASLFEGIVMTGFTQQMTMHGDVNVYPAQTVGILRWGRAWALVPDDVFPEYNDPAYLIVDGDDAGKFTNEAADNVAIKATFIGGRGTGAVAPVALYNQKSE